MRYSTKCREMKSPTYNAWRHRKTKGPADNLKYLFSKYTAYKLIFFLLHMFSTLSTYMCLMFKYFLVFD